MTAIARRATLIYVYYVLSSVAVILLITAAAGSIKNAGVIDQSFIVLREDPISTIWSTIFLISPPDLPGLLVLYLVLTLIVILLFLIGAARNAALTLAAVSFGQFRNSIPNWPPIWPIIRTLTHLPGSFSFNWDVRRGQT